MDVLDRLAALQNEKSIGNVIVEKDDERIDNDAETEMLNGDIHNDDGDDQDTSGDKGDYIRNDGEIEYNRDMGEEIDNIFGVVTTPDVEVQDNVDMQSLGVNGDFEDEKRNESPLTFKPNMRAEDLIQFWSPAMLKQIGKKTTPKSRFQPKRKTASKQIDYSDSKKRDTPKTKKKETLAGKLMKRLKKKDDTTTTSRKTKKDLRVSRRSVMEISKMKKLRKQTHQNRLRNEKNMKLALQSGGYMPVRTINVTKPKEFNFGICNRTKEHTMNTRSSADKPFETKLRTESTTLCQDYKNENTKPVPFKFALSQTTSNGENGNWESMAQAAMNFQNKTPTRFRLKPSEEDKSFLEKKVVKQKSITMPVTPKLLTRGRSRRYKIDAAKEQEEKEIEKMLNYKFKATELNPKIMEGNGMYGVKNVAVSATTEAKPFHFEIEDRIYNRTCKDATLLHEDTSALEKTKLTTSSGKLKPTQIKPFSFESKDKARYAKKEEKIKEQILAEKKMHEFQASLLPSSSPDVLPAVPTKKATKQKPFNISEGSILYQSKLDLTLKVEAEEERAKRQFKAQSADVVKKKPFQPITGLIPATNISNIKLNTDARAEERESQEYWKKQKEKFLEEQRIELEKQKKLAEEAEIKELRKNAVHKANPIPNFKPLEIKKSDIPLTEPQTPNLQVKKRALARLEESRDHV